MKITNFDWDKYIASFEKYGIKSPAAHGMLKQWQHPMRVYHGLVHLIDMLEAIDKDFEDRKITQAQYDLFVTAALVHDVVYVPGGKDNEQASIEQYLLTVGGKHPAHSLASYEKIDEVVKLVEATKYQVENIDLADDNVRRFLRYDLDTLCTDDIAKMVSKEELVFKEFQAVDYKLYREGRSKMLGTLSKLVKLLEPTSLIDQYIRYIHEKKRRIAIFPGSFNPLHLGHVNIINKAEEMFDKVIVAPGFNPSKAQASQATIDTLRTKLRNQIDPFPGFLHDYVKSKMDEYTDFVVIKGMGRHVDFEDHKMQQRYVEDMYPDIKFTYIIPDRKVEHYASSAVRMIDAVQTQNAINYANAGNQGVDPKAVDYAAKYKF